METYHDTKYTSLRHEVNLELVNAIALLKLVKDTKFCNETGKQLARLKDVMLEDKMYKISTLEEFKKIIKKGVQKTLSKLVLENPTQRINDEIYGSNTLSNLPNMNATNYFNKFPRCNSRDEQFDSNPEERLALRYPRKKICKPDYASTSNISGEMANHSNNSLFKRRHELLALPPQPTTYGEYKRMAQYQSYLRNQNMLQAAIVNTVPANGFNPSNTSTVQTDSRESTATANSGNGAINKTNETDNSINNERVLPETATKTSQQQSVIDGSVTATKSTQQRSVAEGSGTATTTIQQNNVCEDPVHGSGTSGASSDRGNENVQKSKPPKPKNKVNHRELHDLLSYTTEIFPKLISNRRKSISTEEQTNMQLLKAFGITKRVEIVLQRLDTSQIVPEREGTEQIAQRTRSKSIDSRKCLKNVGAAKQTESVLNKISHCRVPKASEVSAAKQKLPVPNNSSYRRESKLLDLKNQQTSATSVNTSKQTARKSMSKPQKSVQPTTGIKKLNEVKQEIEPVTIEKDQKSTKATLSRKRVKTSTSPLPPAKKSRKKDLKHYHTADDTWCNVSEESDEDETTAQLPSSALIRNPKPNNDPNVHCRSDYMEKCCLCSYNGELMVQHYVYNHPKKVVYVSRVAPEQAEIIKADPLGISGRKAISRYGGQKIIVFRCHFCDLLLSESQELWLDHISKHTGEYRYKCMLCPTFARLPVDRVPHNTICTNPSMQLWHTYTFQENHLYAYICNVCNFVQVLSVNILRHIREDHPEAGSSEIGYTKFSLVNFSLQDEDIDLPCGALKLEPILDDTNISIEQNIKVEVVDTPAEDNNSQTDLLQGVEQEQQCLLQPEIVFIKQENFNDSTDQGESNPFEIIAENTNDMLPTFSASVPQETECLSSIRFHANHPPSDVLSTCAGSNIPNKASKNTNSLNHSSVLHTNGNQAKCLTDATVSTGTTSITSVTDSRKIRQVNHASVPQTNNNQRQRSAALKPTNQLSINGQLFPVSPLVVLKPWSEKCDVNSGMLQLNKLTVPFLLAPYKCTAFDCGFYTNKAQRIGSHLQNHQQLTGLHQTQRPWLECCYCDYIGTNIFGLVQHIQTVHKHSGYQCDRCCYRSRDPSNVLNHQRNYHNEHDAKILCIPDRQKAFEPEDDEVIANELKRNVNALKCSICASKKFYDLNEYRKHILAHKMSKIACSVCDQIMSPRELLDHIQLHSIYMFQCIYCACGSNDMSSLMKHLADRHPERLSCLHVRTSKQNNLSFIQIQEEITPDRFVNFPVS